MARYEAVLFDSGGTLFQSGPVEPDRKDVEAGRPVYLQAALSAFGASAETEEIAEVLPELRDGLKMKLGASYSYVDLVDAFARLKELDLTREEIVIATDAYAGPRYRTWLFPGTEDMLSRLAGAGVYVGLIANTDWPGFTFERLLTGVGLRRYFRTLVISCDEGVAKPDPKIFRIALERSGMEGRRILYVGDSIECDIEGARGVGWDAALRLSVHEGSGGLAVFEFAESSELADFVLS